MSELIRVNNDNAQELKDRGFILYKGWNQSLACDLVAKSTEERIVQDTPNDALKRFSTARAADDWHNTGQRTMYSLYGRSLAGVIWYDIRPRQDIDAEYTFAIRLYDEARGRRLARGFMQAAHQDFARLKRNLAVWLETNVDNTAARHLYDGFGYETIGEEDGRVTMVYRSAEDGQ